MKMKEDEEKYTENKTEDDDGRKREEVKRETGRKKI
jgi:hypothetical protein